MSSVHFTPSLIQSLGNKAALIVYGSKTRVEQYLKWINPYLDDNVDVASSSMKLTDAAMAYVGVSQCMPTISIFVNYEFIYVHSGTCDATGVRTRSNPYRKVFSISKWTLDYPFTLYECLEAEAINYNYKAGINSIP